jgi:hypothetical protein
MRAFTIACLLLAVSACKKFDGSDIILPPSDKPAWKPVYDTIPDHASFTLRLSLDSTNYDETVLIFDHKGNLAYDPGSDASYLIGFGKVSLASISTDGREMSIYNLPYQPGSSIGLDVHSKKDAMLSLKVNREKICRMT